MKRAAVTRLDAVRSLPLPRPASSFRLPASSFQLHASAEPLPRERKRARPYRGSEVSRGPYCFVSETVFERAMSTPRQRIVSADCSETALPDKAPL